MSSDWSSTEFQSLAEYNQVLDTIITVTSRSKMEIVYEEYVLIFLRNEHFVEKHFVKQHHRKDFEHNIEKIQQSDLKSIRTLIRF